MKVLICLFWLFCIKVFIYGNDILHDGFTFSTSVGFCVNHIYENVFENNEKESELEWKSYVPSLLCVLDYSYSSLIGTYALNNVSRMTAEFGIGIKNVRILGFRLGDLGHTWTFDLVDPVTANIIPETKFCEIELK